MASLWKCIQTDFFFVSLKKNFQKMTIKGTNKSTGIYKQKTQGQGRTKHAASFFNWLKAQSVTGRKSILNKLESCAFRHRKQTYGYQRGKLGVGDKFGVWYQHLQTAVQKTDQQQAPTAQHRELHSISCDKPRWKNMKKNNL